MGRKSSAKEQRQGPGNTGNPGNNIDNIDKKGSRRLLLAAIVVAAIGGGGYVIWAHGRSASTDPAPLSPAEQAEKEKHPDPNEVAKNEAFAQEMTKLGPHQQASYPPIPTQEFPPPRPYETVNAAFKFAADHPEVLSYIPCFCGCQHGGHRGNEDCFVRARAKNGDVTEWEPHGLECAVCIDVATRSRQMFASGASVTQIREAVEKQFKDTYPSITPTPQPPHSH
jgi:Protein of unknown function with PCYCGC motif